MSEIPEAAITAALSEYRALLYDRPDQTALSDEALARRMLEAALPHLSPPAPDLTGVPWRTGRSHPSNIWARTGGDDWKADTPVGRMDSAEIAARACADHSAVLDLEWLLGAGLDVEVASCGGAGRCCGDAGGRFSVRAARPDPVAALPLPGGVESHGHASPAEALAFAREWCGQNGITP